MNKGNLRSITNHFTDVRLISLATWPHAHEIWPRDDGGPYIVLQEGYDPDDLRMVPDEFVLGHSGNWLPLHLFYRLPVPERRAEFIFGTAAEVMDLMRQLPTKAELYGDDKLATGESTEPDDLTAAFESARDGSRRAAE